jgi:hypothetical protein
MSEDDWHRFESRKKLFSEKIGGNHFFEFDYCQSGDHLLVEWAQGLARAQVLGTNVLMR